MRFFQMFHLKNDEFQMCIRVKQLPLFSYGRDGNSNLIAGVYYIPIANNPIPKSPKYLLNRPFIGIWTP